MLLLVNRTMMKTTVVALLASVAIVSSMPSSLFDERAVDEIMELPTSNGGFNLHFDVPEAFADVDSFMQMAAEVEVDGGISPTDVGRVKFKDEPPILCETICRPMNETENQDALNEAKSAESAARKTEVRAKGVDEAALTAAAGKPTSFLELSEKVCEAKGGAWNFKDKECEEYMRSTKAKTAYDPDAIFGNCKKEFGDKYLPCSPYQALALANMYKVEDHSYFWLWPGGRKEQVKQAALKQEAGHNPSEGLDKCPEKQHVGFFHNWDKNHVDSWGCLHEELSFNVLCCRRG